jgi:hypothetical protein
MHRDFSKADLQKVFANKLKRFQACIDVRGHNFQHLYKCTATFRTHCTFESLSLKWNSIKNSGFSNRENGRNHIHDKLSCCVCMRARLAVWGRPPIILSCSGRPISQILCNLTVHDRIHSSPPLHPDQVHV